MDPGQHGVILAAKLGGPSGGVVGAVGDLGECQEAFAGPWMGGMQGKATEVFERLFPLLHLDAYHDESLRRDPN